MLIMLNFFCKQELLQNNHKTFLPMQFSWSFLSPFISPVFIIALPIPLRSTGQRNRQKGSNRRPERHCSFRRDF